ncbi:MAG: M23 family metallopeptidase [Chloroflexi bacterium]|nr:M23 family metallopeptidase [Chloroflexota bacterium]
MLLPMSGWLRCVAATVLERRPWELPQSTLPLEAPLLKTSARILGLLCLGLALAGCQQRQAAAPTTAPASATATATVPAPTPTATATQTPLPTATPVPTATATAVPPTPTIPPTPTSTPQAISSPAGAPPADRGPLSLEPVQVGQGKTALVRVRTAPGQQVQGSLDGTPLVFVPGPGAAWAVVGVPGLAYLGPRALQIRLTDTVGQVTTLRETLEVVATDWPVEHITLPPGQGDLLAPSIVQAEWDLLRTVSGQSTALPRWRGLFLPPANGPTSSPFGIRRSYNGGPPTGQHQGLDFAVAAGTPIRAAAAGKVVLAQTLAVRGNAVLIDHGAGVVTGYYHMSESLVQEGQEVEQGATIGKAGATGLATGPHLHWDLIVSGVNVDPAEWLDRVIP